MLKIQINTGEQLSFTLAHRVIRAAQQLIDLPGSEQSLDAAKRHLDESFGRDLEWVVYRGGSHVALVLRSAVVADSQSKRVLFISELSDEELDREWEDQRAAAEHEFEQRSPAYLAGRL